MYIYKITNLVNNKIYIGSTVRDLETRFNEHCRPCSKKHFITKAILKHGRDNFRIELLEEVDDYSILFKREGELIRQHNSLHPNGYNLHDNNQYSEPNNGIRKQKRPTDECLELARKARIGSKHTEETLKLISKNRKGIVAYTKPILAINLTTKEEIKFSSIKEASTTLKVHKHSISNILHGWAYKTKNGFTFKFIHSEDK